MLTAKQNLLETIKDKNPDRFVKQYEFMKVVVPPNLKFSEGQWDAAVKIADSVNRDEQFVAPVLAPGLFEMTHSMMTGATNE